MNKVVREAGCVVIALLILAVPALFVLSLCLDWHSSLKSILLITTLGDFGFVGTLVYNLSESRGNDDD